jgi:phosphoglycerate dehydrogenase-like enzyme
MPKPAVISIPAPRRIDLIFTPEDEKHLRDHYNLIEGEPAHAARLLDAHIEDTTFIIGQPALGSDLLRRASQLRAVFNVETNLLDNIDYEQCFERGIHVLTTGKVFAVPVAELGLGLALALERGIASADRDFRVGRERWGGDGNGEARLMSGGDIGFIGFGDLGRAIHGLLAGFSPHVRVFDPWLPDQLLRDMGVEPCPLDDVLTASDVIFVVASVTSENGGFLGAKEFSRMRRGASFVLLSRAAVVDFEALMDAVGSGHIKAASDVFPEEPLPADHPVRSLDGFILSAHRAGAMDVAFKQMGRMVLEDMALMMRGLPPMLCRRAERETIKRMRSMPVSRN